VTLMPIEQRKSPRKPIHTHGFLYAADGRPIGPCQVEDVSVGGAKLIHAMGDELPTQFVLSLARNGQVRRQCQIAWRGKRQIGVRFIVTGSGWGPRRR
jgi:hypothetical protein